MTRCDTDGCPSTLKTEMGRNAGVCYVCLTDGEGEG